MIKHTIIARRIIPRRRETLIIQLWMGQVPKDIITAIERNYNDILQR